jgi:hypothetical protein
MFCDSMNVNLGSAFLNQETLTGSIATYWTCDY